MYLDNILIYAEIVEEYDNIVVEVLKYLEANGLAISEDKCFWLIAQVNFLGYVISKEGIKIALDQV
jgi:hypothetical protein